ncbi:MAG: DNA repair protein RecO [Lachnospiraceae bacterium]|nr:DNA repair protein RecO [Lachnospiraceae bacterium]
MDNQIMASGIVVSSMPVGETDKRVVLLTKELGKVSAFARGAVKPNSPLLAAGNPFCFGNFSLYSGRSAYTLRSVKITARFDQLLKDLTDVWYGYYFLEVAEYYGRENVDESERLNLLYLTLRALEKKKQSPDLIRLVYEIRTLGCNGEYPNVFSCVGCGKEAKEKQLSFFSVKAGGCFCADCHKETSSLPVDIRPLSVSALYALQYILSTPLPKLFSFDLKPQVLEELTSLVRSWRRVYSGHKYKSEEFLGL